MNIRLSPYAAHIGKKESVSVEGGFNWTDAILDALILSALTFFSSLVGVVLVGYLSLIPPLISACVMFFSVLASKRGLGSKS